MITTSTPHNHPPHCQAFTRPAARYAAGPVLQGMVFAPLYLEYPTQALRKAITHALAYDLIDLVRLEKLVLKQIPKTIERRSGTVACDAFSPPNIGEPRFTADHRQSDAVDL